MILRVQSNKCPSVAPVVGRHVGLAPALGPLLLELVLEDLRAPLAGEPRLLDAQLAHLHVIPTWGGKGDLRHLVREQFLATRSVRQN